MATTAKIAKDIKLEKARKAKTPKLQCRHRNRCWRCGRPRAFLRKFGICRLCFRQLALNGEIPRVLGGMGINILTTPRGVMTGRDAHKEHIGGEILCRVW